MKVICIDLGGTKTELAVIENDLVIDHLIQPTGTDFVSQLSSLTKLSLDKNSGVIAISIGVPGPVKDNVMWGSKPLNYEKPLDIQLLLSEFELPVVVKNDLHMAAHDELQNGVGKTSRNFCLVSISTGIGVAAVIDGYILPVRTEVGHTVFDRDLYPPNSCIGHSNCWISMASGAAVQKRYSTTQNESTASVVETLSPEQVSELRYINANGLGAVINAYDPDVISIMGSFGLAQFDLIVPTPKEIEPFTINRPIPNVVRSSREKSLGVRGAYYAALRYLRSVP